MSSNNLRSYIKILIENLFNLSCLCDDFIKSNTDYENTRKFNKPSYVICSEWDDEVTSKLLKKEVGTAFLSIEKEKYDSIEYFLETNLTI